MDVQACQGWQVRLPLAQEKILDVGDLSEPSGVTASDVEHPVVAEPVGTAGQEPGNIGGVP
jgi:hypothetical protein